MSTPYCVYLDAGHGGLDARGYYVTAPGKQFRHDRGIFHGEGWFYEGVWNRTMVDLVARKLHHLNIDYMLLSHEYLDVSLPYRVEKANWYHRNYKPGIVVSTHANASVSHQGRGYEVYTSPGVTAADRLAELHWRQVEALLGQRIIMRADSTDGDHDKEANFYILRRTVMPAVLIEHLFFDNYEDASLLMDDEIIEYFAEAQVRTILEYFG